MNATATISIVIVTWNAKKFTAECLDSLRRYMQEGIAEIIVVDNASTDGTPELVRGSYPEVTLIQNEGNFGFAKANNIGIRRTTGKYVCLINSDVNVLDGCIEKLRAYMEANPKVGLLGPRMLGADREVHRSYMGEPTLWRYFCRTLALDVLFPESRVFGGLLMPFFKGDQTVDMDVLNGWFLMTRREALDEVGLLDETFFIYGEDVDWCKRFHEAGWKVVYFSGTESVHYGGASSARAPVRFYIERHRADFQYWKKYHGPLAQLAYLLMTLMEQAVRFVGYSLLMIAGRSRGSDASFKAKRSLACMRWIMGLGYGRGVEAQ